MRGVFKELRPTDIGLLNKAIDSYLTSTDMLMYSVNKGYMKLSEADRTMFENEEAEMLELKGYLNKGLI